MSHNLSAKIIDGTTNKAVVQMPGRNYPGIVIQGDQLAWLLALSKDKDPQLEVELKELMDHYGQVCKDNGFS